MDPDADRSMPVAPRIDDLARAGIVTGYNASMSKPTPQSVEPGEVRALAEAVLKADRFPYLASIDGDQPRVRPVSPVRTDGFTVYVAVPERKLWAFRSCFWL